MQLCNTFRHKLPHPPLVGASLQAPRVLCNPLSWLVMLLSLTMLLCSMLLLNDCLQWLHG